NQSHNIAVQGGVPDHDDLLNARVDHVIIGRYLVLSKYAGGWWVHGVVCRWCRGLSDGGKVFLTIHGTCFGARDNTGHASDIHLYFPVAVLTWYVAALWYL